MNVWSIPSAFFSNMNQADDKSARSSSRRVHRRWVNWWHLNGGGTECVARQMIFGEGIFFLRGGSLWFIHRFKQKTWQSTEAFCWFPFWIRRWNVAFLVVALTTQNVFIVRSLSTGDTLMSKAVWVAYFIVTKTESNLQATNDSWDHPKRTVNFSSNSP